MAFLEHNLCFFCPFWKQGNFFTCFHVATYGSIVVLDLVTAEVDRANFMIGDMNHALAFLEHKLCFFCTFWKQGNFFTCFHVLTHGPIVVLDLVTAEDDRANFMIGDMNHALAFLEHNLFLAHIKCTTKPLRPIIEFQFVITIRVGTRFDRGIIVIRNV